MPKIRSIKYTCYPLDYNKNNPLEGFNNWSRYIRIECDQIRGYDKAMRADRFNKMIDVVLKEPDINEGITRFLNNITR